MRLKCGDVEVPSRWGNTERPTLDPWVIVEPYRGNATRVVLERNPYFWQVDNAGQQLPYIDRVQLQMISEVETIVLTAINGQLDYQHRHIFGIQNRPVLAENAVKGGYKMMALSGTGANSVGLWLNHSTKNAKLRNLIRNKDFRIALSQAIDRKEINDIVLPWPRTAMADRAAEAIEVVQRKAWHAIPGAEPCQCKRLARQDGLDQT